MARNGTTHQKEYQNSMSYPIVRWFCSIIILTIIVHVGYFIYTAHAFKQSQERIVREHIRHITQVDSIFTNIGSIILSQDSGITANKVELLAQLQKDSLLFKREVQLSQEEVNNLAELQINKMGDDYDQIGVWFGVSSIIFIVFGFFGIFKIEESKKEAKNVLEEIKQKGRDAFDDVATVQEQASIAAQSLDEIRQGYESFVNERAQRIDMLESELKDNLSNSKKCLDSIRTLMSELDGTKQKYEWSIDVMEKQMTRLEEIHSKLTTILSEIIKKTNE